MRALKFLTQKGMTLPEVMIAAALMGGVALITAKLMGDQTNNEAYLKAKAEVLSTTTRIESFLNNPQQCTSMLRGKQVTVAGTSVGAAGLFLTTPAGETINIIKEAEYQAFKILANGIQLRSSVYGDSLTDLVITFSMKGKSFFTASGQRDIVKKIPIVTQLDAAKTIVACGPVLGDSEAVGQKKMCDSLAGAASWDGSKCILHEVKCPWGQVATQMTSLGGIVCTPLVNQVKLDELFDLNGVDCIGKPYVQLISSSGKLKITCSAGACTPVNGGWSTWTEPAWSTCSGGTQTRTRTRTCTNPSPNSCGTSCSGSSNDPQSQACGVDCSSFENPLNESGGCVEIDTIGDWNSVSDGCECRDIGGPFKVSCNHPDGRRDGTECQPKP